MPLFQSPKKIDLGVAGEIVTNELHNGKPVYFQKFIDLSPTGGNALNTVDLSSNDIDVMVDIYGYGYNAALQAPVNCNKPAGNLTVDIGMVYRHDTQNILYEYQFSGFTSFEFSCFYTKTTD